jgi:predicted DNA-binding transcriptional regulator YafY
MEQLFSAKTDEQHAITGGELIRILEEMGIKAERKTIYDDIATLCDAGLDIRTTKSGHSNAYYMGSRLFDDDELRILVDAVSASRFLTIKKTGELIRKLQTLTSEHRSQSLRRAVHIENRTKSANDQTYNIIDTAQEAMFLDRQIDVVVQEPGSDRKRQGRHIAVSPYHVVLENERYYIIGKSREGVIKLKTDRIAECAMLREKRETLTEDEETEARRLKLPSFSAGGEERLRIRFEASVLEEICDRFGDKAAIRADEGGCFMVEAEVRLSNEFWGWLFSLGNRAKIVSPLYAAELARERAERIADGYRR